MIRPALWVALMAIGCGTHAVQTAVEPPALARTAPCFREPSQAMRISHSPVLDFPADFTMEIWVYPRSSGLPDDMMHEQQMFLQKWQSGREDKVLRLTVDGGFGLYLFTGPFPGKPAGTGFSAGQPAPVERWSHVAIVARGGQASLFVDGRRAGTQPLENGVVFNGSGDVYLGRSPRDLPLPSLPPPDLCAVELRLSSIARYDRDFRPELRLTSDAATLGLWHLDEIEGATAVDTGPNALHGVFIGIVERVLLPQPAAP